MRHIGTCVELCSSICEPVWCCPTTDALNSQCTLFAKKFYSSRHLSKVILKCVFFMTHSYYSYVWWPSLIKFKPKRHKYWNHPKAKWWQKAKAAINSHLLWSAGSNHMHSLSLTFPYRSQSMPCLSETVCPSQMCHCLDSVRTMALLHPEIPSIPAASDEPYRHPYSACTPIHPSGT